MSIIVYNEVEEPIVPIEGLAGRVREALGDALRSMRYVTPDFDGLYQDALGTTPVTAVGQPVGLMLDRRFGLERGAEIVPDEGRFFDTSFWTPSVAGVVLSEGSVFFNTESQGSAARSTPSVIAGRAYLGEVEVESISRGLVYAVIGLPSAWVPLAVGVNKFIQVATNERIQVFGNTEAVIRRFSVRELPGNHASQTTTTARPTLRSGPLRIDYDGVDDYLRTVFPDLGGDVTIARSIPGVGAQILTGQTIAAGNWDDNVTSCATLVIDRALTGPETALVTAFLNQQAGV